MLGFSNIISQNQSRRRLIRIICSILIIGSLSYGIRITTIGWHGLNDAEAQTVALAGLPDLGQLFRECMLDGNTPAFYLLVRMWTFLFGSSDLALKVLSLLISGVFPVIVYLIVSRRLNEKIAWQTAILVAFNPSLLYDGEMVRPYALAALLALVVTDRLFRLLSDPKAMKYRVQYSFLMAFMMYCHIFTVSVPIAHCLYVALGLLRGWLNWKQARTWLASSCLALLLFIPWVISMKAVAQETAALWPSGPNFPACFFLIGYTAVNYFGEYEPLTKSSFCWTLVCCSVALLCPLAFRRNQGRLSWLLICYWVGIANIAVLAYILAGVVHAFHVRHVSHAIAFILLMFAAGMDWMVGRLPKFVSISLPVIVMVLWWSPQLMKIKELSIGSVYQAAQPIIANFDKSKDLVVCAYEVYAPECERQLPKGFKLITFPDLEKVDYVYFPGFHNRFLDEKYYLRAEEIMKTTLEHGGKVWFIEHQVAKHLKWFRRSSITGKESIYELEFIAADRLRDWLFTNAIMEGQPRYFTSNDTSLAERSFVAKK
jgi:hypothetical protein